MFTELVKYAIIIKNDNKIVFGYQIIQKRREKETVAVSIRDVARRAGVSNGTVSRAFNHYTDILPETRERILAAARELGYTPNVSARSLSAKRPPNIALIAANLLRGDERDAMISQVIKGILSYTAAHGMELSLYSPDPAEQSGPGFVDFCRLHSVSGALVSGLRTDDPSLAELVHSDTPVVGVDLRVEGAQNGWIATDNRAAAREAAGFLLSRCPGRLVIVAGHENTFVNESRMAGTLDAFREAGRTLAPDDRVYAGFSEENARRLFSEWLDRHGGPPDAVFCFSDLMALGVLRALRSRGLRSPEDVKIMGFDGMPFTSLTTPTLSTVEQDMPGIGREAARMLHELMDGRCAENHRYLPYRLALRESTGG